MQLRNLTFKINNLVQFYAISLSSDFDSIIQVFSRFDLSHARRAVVLKV